MYIKELSLLNFRNIAEATVSFGKKINILYGDNAQGKTNLLEAIYICSTGRSQKTHIEGQLVKFGYDEAHIRTFVCRELSTDRIDVHIKKDNRKGMAVNGLAVKKMSDFFGNLYAVIFSPEDLRLVKGGPSERRKFIDIELCQLSKVYCHNLQNYHRVLKQRNNLLKNIHKNKNLADTIPVWDEQMLFYGEKIIEKREEFIEKINDVSKNIHSEITGKKESLSIEYKPNVDKKNFGDKLVNSREKDIIFGITSCGPHKDDMSFFINGNDTKFYGSQGQQRTASLSAKLAEISLIESETGTSPILLLDDVLSELDESRQIFLMKNIGELQTFITCTGIEDSISKYIKDSTTFNVKNGEFKNVN
ncbi:DNA replication and repair protein RecF [bioreactor metagenome]|uniref:DNA replication and repair protein RecF n=1 Tax=bioreactor metagenome TaxID=1076179 RepID=A0A644Y800_9ZZZZ|nr:DNA replication/repair protein RecF [Candidatus Metalachnospira sp.]